MTSTQSRLLPPFLVFSGLVSLSALPLHYLWPSGWEWGMEGRHYLHMILVVYARLGVFLILAAKDPLANRSLRLVERGARPPHGVAVVHPPPTRPRVRRRHGDAGARDRLVRAHADEDRDARRERLILGVGRCNPWVARHVDPQDREARMDAGLYRPASSRHPSGRGIGAMIGPRIEGDRRAWGSLTNGVDDDF